MGAIDEFSDGQLVPGTKYRVVTLIGRGGMGAVYEVEHLELGKCFVLKALQRELGRRADLVQRLRTEWRALGQLEHAHIVTVTDAGETDDGVPYFVMERLNGQTLGGLIAQHRRIPVRQSLEIAAQIADGLGAAHAIGVVHRDVNPANAAAPSRATASRAGEFVGLKKLDIDQDVRRQLPQLPTRE